MATPEVRLGPLVHRAVHHAAILWLVATVQFVVAMALVQWRWTGQYDLRRNYISDLGNTACGVWPASSGRLVCSPWHTVFNGSVIVFGLLTILGVLLVVSAFPPRSSRSVGLGLLALAGIGAVGVGVFPENVNLTAHSISALLAFVGASLGLAELRFALIRDTRWDGYRSYPLFSGLVGLVALGLYLGGVYDGLGPGGMERLIVAPSLLWLGVVSVHLLRVPAYAPRIIPRSSGP